MFKNEIGSRVGKDKDKLSTYSVIFKEVIPQVFNSYSVNKEKREAAKAVILGFFQACYTFKEHDNSDETREKARLIFNEIFQQCEKREKT